MRNLKELQDDYACFISAMALIIEHNNIELTKKYKYKSGWEYLIQDLTIPKNVWEDLCRYLGGSPDYDK